MSLTVWDISVSRDNGGERWKWPRIEWPKRYRHAFSTRVGMRVGWRMTAWGLHVGRTFVSDEKYPEVAAAAKAASR